MTFSINDVLSYMKDIAESDREDVISVDEALYEATQIRKTLEKISGTLSDSDNGFLRLSILRVKDLESRLLHLLDELDQEEGELNLDEVLTLSDMSELNNFLYGTKSVKQAAPSKEVHSDDFDIDLSQYFGTESPNKAELSKDNSCQKHSEKPSENIDFQSFLYGILSAMNSVSNK